MKDKANDIVMKFRHFLLSSWEAFSPFVENLLDDEKEERINNWLQANWEILVEANLCGVNEFLEVYGYGADCNGASSRICFTDKLPTHKIVCNSINQTYVRDVITSEMKNITGMTFDGFMSWNGEFYEMSAPFDFILLTNESSNVLISINDVNFSIEKI